MTAFRDFFRRRRVRRHVARNGRVFDFHGQRVSIPESAGIGAASGLLRGKYEAEEAAMIGRHLRSDQTVIELGGSLGVIARLIRSRLDPDIRHVVVEANPALIETCRANAVIRDGDPTEIVAAAIHYDGPVARFELSGNVHANRVSGAGAGQTIEVPAMTLGDIRARAGDPDTYALVCDIEGGELPMVMRDGPALARASLVIMELHPQYYPGGTSDEAAIRARMAELGLEEIDRVSDVSVWKRP
jgi:FkbM family methyltransferase